MISRIGKRFIPDLLNQSIETESLLFLASWIMELIQIKVSDQLTCFLHSK